MYIRAKDGVYDTSKGLYTPSIKMWAIDTVTIYDEDILKQSENLEELCDEFVKVWNKTKINPEVLQYDEEIEYEKEMMSHYPKGNITIYGAIWTDKGLIYVAKMDSEGELVLI